MSGGNESSAPVIPDTVQITIRCALQALEDQTIEASTIWTVKQLKEQIASQHPSHPNSSTLKLIYGGHCLQDERVLRNIFEVNPPVVDGPTVFLLVRPSTFSEPQLRQRTNARTPVNQQQQLPTYEEYLQNSVGSNQNYTDYYRNLMNFYQTHGQNYGSAPATAGQDYIEYYRNLINYYNSQGGQFFGVTNPFPHAVYINNGAGMPFMPYYVNPGQAQPVNLTGGNRPPIVVNAAIFPQGAQNVRPAQAPPAAERRVGMFENGLELFYRAIRILFVLCAVMLYSSVERLILVVAIVLIILATQYRRAEIRRAAANAAPINNNNTGEPAENRAAPDGEERPERAGEENVEEIIVQPPPVSTLQTVLSAVLSFFSSLIPDHIPVEVA